MAQIEIPSPLVSKVIRIESRSEAKHLSFRLGEIFAGKVIEQIDDLHAIVQIEGQNLLVENRIPLSKEMEGYFRVEATSPQVVLKLLLEGEETDPMIGSMLRKYLSSDLFLEDISEPWMVLQAMKGDGTPSQIRETIEQLFRFLEKFSLDSPLLSDPHRIQEMIPQSGLFFENKLQRLIETRQKGTSDQIIGEDLKGILLKLKAQLSSFPGEGLENLLVSNSLSLKGVMKSLDQILHKIEGYQIFNLIPSDSQERVFLLLPVWFENYLQLVEMDMKLPHPDPKHPESEEMAILFLLDLPEWGRVSIDLKIRGKGLYCQVNLSDPEGAAFIHRVFPELEARLIGVGFQSHLNLSLVDQEKIPKTLLPDLEERCKSLLNVVV